ncbi:hypothetical protein L211DRAFT_673389 [Terfezia boudieri ATCC MYA-4762]|uniref:Uncharacterized protein n=1 Tax=Terfezia boudieri ATCC MYA-4762 TaxID=1051890 RepID=A0A3N4LB23_9PEZI|nr:hypothetical protein L211DRAFT_673389 [Terfezia boudieri ATCC MYA-4762]
MSHCLFGPPERKLSPKFKTRYRGSLCLQSAELATQDIGKDPLQLVDIADMYKDKIVVDCLQGRGYTSAAKFLCGTEGVLRCCLRWIYYSVCILRIYNKSFITLVEIKGWFVRSIFLNNFGYRYYHQHSTRWECYSGLRFPNPWNARSQCLGQ